MLHKTMDELSDAYQEQVSILKLNVDERYTFSTTGKHMQIGGKKWSDFQTTHFKINSQPFYALVNPQGQLLNQLTGYEADAGQYL